MAENSDSEKSLDVELPEGLDDDDLGEDWETAFEAEDFFVDDSDDTGDFFLADDDSGEDFDLAALLDQESADLAESKDDKQPGEEEIQQEQTAETTADEEPEKSLIPLIFLLSFWRRYQALKVYQKIAVPLLPACLILAALFFFRSKAPDQEIADLVDPAMEQKTVAAKIAESPSETAVSPVPAELAPKTAKIIEKPDAQEDKPAPAKAMLRRKWPFPSFFIASEQKDNKGTVFVDIDLTLITLLPQGVSLPVDKETFVRNMIYQFYINQPAYELKRYSLARGEMIRRLRSWISRQWPDSPIETIAFNRYQVLK